MAGLITLSLIKLRTFSRINSSVLGSSALPMCLNKAVKEAAPTKQLELMRNKTTKMNAKICSSIYARHQKNIHI